MPKIVLVTGANRGIGFCMVQRIAEKSEDCVVLVASRDLTAAEEAIASLKGLRAILQPVALDVASDESIRACLDDIDDKHGKLDGEFAIEQVLRFDYSANSLMFPDQVLVNNAGIAVNPSDAHADFRSAYSRTFDVNITAVGLLTSLAMPLLQQSSDPRVINISSGRASIHNITTGNLPPTASVPYSVSKVALNALTLELAKVYPDVSFYAANPGHCKTAFNGYKGKKDPLEGARVVEELALAEKGVYGSGFWQCEEGIMSEMRW